MADLRLACLALILLSACNLLEDDPEEQTPTPDAREMEPVPSGSPEEAELNETNQARADNGRPAFIWSTALAAVAEAHSQDMCDRGFFSHTNPDGVAPAQRVTAAGISWRAVAENIAQGYPTASAVHIGWMNSPGHRANILNGALGKIGIGYVACGGMHYWTQAFTD